MRDATRKAALLTAVGVLCISGPLNGSTRASIAEAAMRGDRDAVHSLIEAGADVDEPLGDGMTALHWSAVKNEVDLAALLLKAGASLEVKTRLGAYTPLLLAAREGHPGILEVLIQAGADPNATTSNGTTPLMFAAAAGIANSVQALLRRGAAVEAKETKGQTALMFAASRGRTAAIRELVTHGADVNATASFIDLTVPPPAPPPPEPGRLVLDPGNDTQLGRAGGNFPDNRLRAGWGGLSPLQFAVRQGHTAAVQELLAAGADVNLPSAGPNRTSPLLVATINGEFDIAGLLLDHGADPNFASENGVTPLYAAPNCEWATPDAYPRPRAQQQQRTTYLQLMARLLEKGADPNARLNKSVWYGDGTAGATTFWRAAYAADLKAMRLLVVHGADPDIWTTKIREKRARAHDPGQVATVPDYISPLPPLPIGGADVSPLLATLSSLRTAPTGMMAAVKYLVEDLGLDVNATDDSGRSVLHEAAARGDNEMVRYLVAKGANPLAVTRSGLTTVDMANGPVQKIQPFPETIALLEGLGAKNNNVCVSC